MPKILQEISGEITPERMKGMEPKQKQYSLVGVTGDRSKVRCYKEQYYIGTWNVMTESESVALPLG